MPYAFLLPFGFLYVTFWAIPAIRGLSLSLHAGEAFSLGPFVGTQHYERLFFDERFQSAFAHTALFAGLALATVLPLSLITALLLQASWRRLRGLFRFILLLPGLTAPAALAALLALALHPTAGLVNNFLLVPFGRPEIDWLRDDPWILPALLLQATWRWSGPLALVLLAALESIPRPYLDAAAIAGASHWTTFWRISLPFLAPVLLFGGVFIVWDAFSLSADVHLLFLRGGVGINTDRLIVPYIFLAAFRFLRFGYATAIGYATAPILALSLFAFLRYRRPADAAGGAERFAEGQRLHARRVIDHG
ncbi:MAG TPA: sugar ABC transporter permease [Limnochordia bacterium]